MSAEHMLCVLWIMQRVYLIIIAFASLLLLCITSDTLLWAFSIENDSPESLLNACIAGYAFIYFEDERDAEDAIRRLDKADFGHGRRRLSVEWSRVKLHLRALTRHFLVRADKTRFR
jgi:hypothetical protein